MEALPIGTLVFQISGEETKIITINDRLLTFANMVHTYVDTKDREVLWTKEQLYAAFKQNIYAFAVDEDVWIVKELVEEATKYGFSQKTFRLRGTSGKNTKWINSMCSSRLQSDESRIYYTLFMDNTSQVLYERQLLDKQKELEHISHYDALTNVCNRYSYNEYLEKNRAQIKQRTGIVFTDVNEIGRAHV